jgi:DNA ligase 1
MRTTLYKLDSSMRLREWIIWVENHDSKSFVYINYGLSGGQHTFEKIEFPNHLASSPLARNPSTHVEAAKQEYERRAVKQIERRGYIESIPTQRPIKPMLANVYQYNMHHVPPRVYIQPKLNGQRCLASHKWMMSREGTNFYSLQHIQAALSFLPEDVILDGELYHHGWSLQQIMSCCRRDQAIPDSFRITYNIYDIVDENMVYADRYEALKELFPKLQEGYQSFFPDTPIYHMTNPPDTHFVEFPLNLVTTHQASSKEIDKYLKTYIDQKYEGIIIRSPYVPYETGTRSLGLLKYKLRQTITCKILDVLPSRRDHTQGVLSLYSPKHTKFFCSVKGGGERFRSLILRKKENYIGKLCDVEMEDYSEDNIPIQPVCTRIYENVNS